VPVPCIFFFLLTIAKATDGFYVCVRAVFAMFTAVVVVVVVVVVVAVAVGIDLPNGPHSLQCFLAS